MNSKTHKFMNIVETATKSALQQPDKTMKDNWLKSKSRADYTPEEFIARFKQVMPDFDPSFLMDAGTYGIQQEMLKAKLEAKRIQSEIYQRGLKSGEFKKKPFVTQTEINTSYSMADTGKYNSGVEVLTKQSENKPSNWLETAKALKKPKKISIARSKVMTKTENKKYLAVNLTQARATNETNQNLAGALTAFIGSKKAMAILVDHETRLQQSEERHSRAELNIAALQAELAILKGESREERIRIMIAEGFTHVQIAASLKISRSTVTRAMAKVINP